MSRVELALRRRARLANEAEACRLLWSWLGPLSSSVGGLVWLLPRGAHEALSVDRLPDVLLRSALGRSPFDVPTHRMRLFAVGADLQVVCRLRVGPAVEAGGWGLTLQAGPGEWEEDELAQAFVTIADGGTLDEGWVGPLALTRGAVNLVCFSRALPGRLPEAAHARSVSGGLLLFADPNAVDEAPQQRAVQALAAALDGHPITAEPASALPKTRAQEVVQPSYLRDVAPAPPGPDETAITDGRAVLEGLKNRGLPFDLSAPVVAPAPSAAAIDQSGETHEMDVRDVRAALVAEGIAIGAPQPAAPATTPSAPDVDETAMVDNRAILAALEARGLPFDAQAKPKTPSAAQAPVDQSGETAEMDVRDVREALAKRGVAVGPAMLPLERFAEIQAQLARGGVQETVLGQAGLSAEQWQSIVARQVQVLRTDVHVRQRYEQLLEQLMKGRVQ